MDRVLGMKCPHCGGLMMDLSVYCCDAWIPKPEPKPKAKKAKKSKKE
jgi:hypothetical protein